MIYRFDSHGHGKVLADDRREDLESFLGLHYTAVAISKSPSSYLVWFREGQSQSIDWGGDPRTAVEQQGHSLRLSPRKSFEKWRQEVAHPCPPRSEQNLLRAKAIEQSN